MEIYLLQLCANLKLRYFYAGFTEEIGYQQYSPVVWYGSRAKERNWNFSSLSVSSSPVCILHYSIPFINCREQCICLFIGALQG